MGLKQFGTHQHHHHHHHHLHRPSPYWLTRSHLPRHPRLLRRRPLALDLPRRPQVLLPFCHRLSSALSHQSATGPPRPQTWGVPDVRTLVFACCGGLSADMVQRSGSTSLPLLFDEACMSPALRSISISERLVAPVAEAPPAPAQELAAASPLQEDHATEAAASLQHVTEPTPLEAARARCRCTCGCRRTPGRRVICGCCQRNVGPGCCLITEFPPVCHRCTHAEPEPDPEQPRGSAAAVDAPVVAAPAARAATRAAGSGAGSTPDALATTLRELCDVSGLPMSQSTSSEEAAQATEAECAIPPPDAKSNACLWLVGDHMQLQPHCESRAVADSGLVDAAADALVSSAAFAKVCAFVTDSPHHVLGFKDRPLNLPLWDRKAWSHQNIFTQSELDPEQPRGSAAAVDAPVAAAPAARAATHAAGSGSGSTPDALATTLR